MATLFPHPSQRLIEQSQALNKYFERDKDGKRKVEFNSKDPLHNKFIQECTESVIVKLTELQNIDVKIALGYATGLSAFVLSFLLPFTSVAIAGFVYGAYYMGRRQYAYAEYTVALENLSQCCIWTLGEVGPRAEELRNNQAINEMMEVLAPLTDKTQLAYFIDDRIEAGYIASAEEAKKNIKAFDQQLEQDQVAFYFKIYGYRQGFAAISQLVGYAILSALAVCKKAISDKIAGAPADNMVLATPRPQ